MQFSCVTAQPVEQHPGVAHSHPLSAVGAVGFEQLEYPALHVGEHVPAAVQDVDDAFSVEHARPHAPQLDVVSVEPQPPELLPELLLELPLLLPLELLPLLDPLELELDESSPPSSVPPEPLPLDDDEPDELPDEELPDDEPLPDDPLDDVPPEPLSLAETVVVVAFGADGWQVCPSGQPCDPSQNAAHVPPMQMSFCPQVADPCTSAHVSPSSPGPALMHE
jgi:hypothetical protein